MIPWDLVKSKPETSEAMEALIKKRIKEISGAIGSGAVADELWRKILTLCVFERICGGMVALEFLESDLSEIEVSVDFGARRIALRDSMIEVLKRYAEGIGRGEDGERVE